MIVGCYTLDLYCENADPSAAGYRTQCPHRWGHFPTVFTGETEGECLRAARRSGWFITRERYAYCPTCSGKRKPMRKAAPPQDPA